MDKNLDTTLIVAIACEDRTGQFNFVNFEKPVDYNEIQFKEDRMIVENSVIHYKWYQSVTVCTEEIVQEFRKTLQIA